MSNKRSLGASISGATTLEENIIEFAGSIHSGPYLSEEYTRKAGSFGREHRIVPNFFIIGDMEMKTSATQMML